MKRFQLDVHLMTKFNVVAVLMILMLTVAGCAKSTEIKTHAAGHEIRANIEGNHSLETQSDQAVISSPFGKVTVERARVRVEGAPWTTIPEGVLIKVRIAKGKVRVNAGSVTIAQTID